MLNNQENKETFAAFLRRQNLEDLRLVESDLVEMILRHYDELEMLFDNCKADKAENENITLVNYECNIAIFNNCINRDMQKLAAVRSAIDYQFNTTLINVAEKVFHNLFEDKD